jgi:hypothetical protein
MSDTWRRKRPQWQTVPLGLFVQAWDGSTKRDSIEEVIVFNWGPILLVFPRHLKSWL